MRLRLGQLRGRPRRLGAALAAVVLGGVTVAWMWPGGGDAADGVSGEAAGHRASGRSDDAPAVDDDEPDEAAARPTAKAGPPARPTTTLPPRAQPVLLQPTGGGALSGHTIVVDPGHNGRNSRYPDAVRTNADGTEGPLCNTTGSSTNAGLAEYEINWRVGEELTALLRGAGASVVLTHPDTDGFGPCADERGRVAQQFGATALVSIHADGSAAGNSGFHVITKPPGDELSRRSAALASAVRDELVGVGGRPADYVGRDGIDERSDLANLNNSTVPSVLVELGNLRNPDDAAMLSNGVSYRVLAAALGRAIVEQVAGDVPFGLWSDLDGDGAVDHLPDPVRDYLQWLSTSTVPPLPPPNPSTSSSTVPPGPSSTTSPSTTSTSTTSTSTPTSTSTSVPIDPG